MRSIGCREVSVVIRIARVLITALTALVFTGGLAISDANAARGWCRVDPVIMVDGQLADVFVGSSASMLLQATGPIKMVITIPNGSNGIVVLTDLGFLRGYNIEFKHSSKLTKTKRHTQIQISVYAPATTSLLPVTVTFAPRSLESSLKEILFGTSVTGTSNQWIKLTTR
jgi:hypothetical protein